MNQQRWLAMMDSLELPSSIETYESLVCAYSEPHRHYHAVSHIQACLDYLDEVRELADQPDEINIALWFHDAIYNPLSVDNELNSANWAQEFLDKHSVSPDRSARIRALIMATLHNAPTRTKDESLLVDIDLAILGCDTIRYKEFERAVREEYKRIPSFIFMKKRKEILATFLAKDRIYQNEYFHEKLEKQARENLSNVLASK